jgi:hypothetical protein
MATQTINFPFLAGESGLSLRLRSLSTRAIVATQSASESTANNGVQTAAFIDIPAADYLLQLISGTDILGQDVITLTLTSGQFWPASATASSGGGGGGSGDAEQATSLEILAAVEALGATALSAATWTAGSITGFPATLVIGDSYIDDVNRHIKIYYRDENDDPITTIGSKSVTDVDFTASLRISQDNLSSVVTATCVWVPTVGPTEGYLKVELPKDQTRRAAEGVAQMQLVFKWGTSIEVQVASQTVTWQRKI